ncbi:MAG: hypothetical protein CMJ81_01690 [Planctomycetaceae bacterium]|nr:hypothetical protein [Planctomycetaceae bacterium]
MLIGGGLSLVVVAWVLPDPSAALTFSAASLPLIILLSAGAHFAASTVRLYTKPGAFHSLPFITMALPLVTLVLLTACIGFAGKLGPHLTSLYLTWSPYHYAAQAYGLAVMYCYRSGCLLSEGNKKLLWWMSMIPFFYVFTTGPNVGLHWIDMAGWLDDRPSVNTFLKTFQFVLLAVGIVGTVYLWRNIWLHQGRPMPLISVLVLIANAVWWFILRPRNAFVWATIFHSIQYLAIVVFFHVKDQMGRPNQRHGVTYHVLWFYGACVLLGYALFSCFPQAYVLAGFGPVESVLLVGAAVNIHHFFVDGYIWRLKKTDANRTIVDTGATAPL